MSWLLGNAEQLPVDDESYDVYTVAFGIRNMTHIETVITLICFTAISRHLCFLCIFVDKLVYKSTFLECVVSQV